jgi:hypothetical protein
MPTTTAEPMGPIRGGARAVGRERSAKARALSRARFPGEHPAGGGRAVGVPRRRAEPGGRPSPGLFIHKPLFDRQPYEETVDHRYVPPVYRHRLLNVLATAFA